MRSSEPKSRHVRTKELESLLRTPGCARDAELEAVAGVGPCCALPDGSVLARAACGPTCTICGGPFNLRAAARPCRRT